MSPTLSLSRVRVPRRRRGVVHRGRLLDSLHQGIEKKLSYISAPAGYGKTALLLDFLFEVDANIAWYQISQDDRTLRDFVRYLTLSLQQQYPDFGEGVEEMLLSARDQIDPVQVAVAFTNEVVRAVDDFTLLFIDDFHVLSEVESVAVFIWQLMEHLPGQLRLVMASRNEYGIPTARLYVRGEISLLGKEDLAFRADEIQSIVNLVHHRKLNDEDAEELARRSDGWIVAILLALRTENGTSISRLEGGTEQVYKFLAEDVVRNEPENLREFMLDTSIVDEFSADLGGYLAEIDDAAERIDDLDQRNLFIVQIDTSEGVTYRYHQLFMEFLRSSLETEDPARHRTLHDRAGDWYARHGEWEKAVEHKLQAGDREQAAAWMDQEAKQRYVAGRTDVISRWVDILTETPDLLRKSPELLLNRAKTLINQGAFTEAEKLLELAEPVFEKTGAADKRKNTMITRGMGYIQKGRFHEALKLTKRFRKIWSEPAETALGRFREHQVDRIEGLALARTGGETQGLVLLEAAVEGLQVMMDEVQAGVETEEEIDRRTLSHDLELTYSTLGVVSYEQGLIEKAQAAFQRALDLQRSTGGNRRQLATALNNLGYLNNLTGQYRLAVPLLREALEIIRPLNRSGSDIFILNSWGEWLMDIGELEMAEEQLQRAFRIGEPLNQPRMIGQTHLLLAGLESFKGEFNQAFHHLRESARIRGETQPSEANLLMTAKIRLEMGQEELACEALEQALAMKSNGDRPTQQHTTAMFLLGVVKFRLGDEKAARACLEQALSGAAALGYDQFLVVAGQRTEDFWRFAAREFKGSAQLESLIQRVESFQTGIDAYLEPEPEAEADQVTRLEVFGFGHGRVILNGSLIANSVWRAAKSREIFFFILDNGGSRSASIKLEFWPDRDPIKATSVFQSTLWRARKALGDGEIIVLDSDKYQVSPQVEIWYDVVEFERMLERADNLPDEPRKRANVLQQAVDLYSGDFLEDVFSDWASARRDRLNVRYLAALKDLADLEAEAGHLNKARSYYERIVDLNPYRDDAHLAIAGLLMNMGRPNAAREYCRKVVAFLHDEGLSPSIEFSNFLREIAG